MDREALLKSFNMLKAVPGLSDQEIAGILGNLNEESRFNPAAVNPSSGAYGVSQLLGARRTSLDDFAARTGGEASQLATQMGFLVQEMTNPELAPNAWAGNPNNFFGDQDLSLADATTQFADNFLRMGQNERRMDDRLASAEQIFDLIASGALGDGAQELEDNAMEAFADTVEPMAAAKAGLTDVLSMLGGEQAAMPERTTGDDLIALGVGLAQLGAGEAPDISQTVARQNQRRMQQYQIESSRQQTRLNAASKLAKGQDVSTEDLLGLRDSAIRAGMDPRIAQGLIGSKEGRQALGNMIEALHDKSLESAIEGETAESIQAILDDASQAGVSQSKLKVLGTSPEARALYLEDKGIFKEVPDLKLAGALADDPVLASQWKNVQLWKKEGILAPGLQAKANIYQKDIEADAQRYQQVDSILADADTLKQFADSMPPETEISAATETLANFQPIMNDIILMLGGEPIELVPGNEAQYIKQINAFLGRTFQDFHKTGTGPLSDRETRMLRRILPEVVQGFNQGKYTLYALRNAAIREKAILRYREEYRDSVGTDASSLEAYNRKDMNAYVQQRLAEDGVGEIFKTLRPEQLKGVVKSGMSSEEVIAAMDAAGYTTNDLLAIETLDEKSGLYTVTDFGTVEELVARFRRN